MVKNREISLMEEIDLVTPTPDMSMSPDSIFDIIGLFCGKSSISHLQSTQGQ